MVGDILQPTHLLFILVVALLVLGPKRLPEVGRTLGSGLRDFRQAISGDSPSSYDWTHQMAESTEAPEQRHQPSFESDEADLPDVDLEPVPSSAAPVATTDVEPPSGAVPAEPQPAAAAPLSTTPLSSRPSAPTAVRPVPGAGSARRIPRPGESVQRPARSSQRSSG